VGSIPLAAGDQKQYDPVPDPEYAMRLAPKEALGVGAS